MSHNYGLKFDEEKPEDYKFGGGFVPMDVLQPDGQWDFFLPFLEEQSNDKFDSTACASFGTLSAIEILIKRLYNK